MEKCQECFNKLALSLLFEQYLGRKSSAWIDFKLYIKDAVPSLEDRVECGGV